MASKIVAVLFLIGAGFFVYMVTVLAFFTPEPPVSPRAKYVIMACFSVPIAVLLPVGLYGHPWRNRALPFGIVLVSGAGVTIFVALSIICFRFSPELSNLPDNKLHLFADFIPGFGLSILLIAIGLALIRKACRPRIQPECDTDVVPDGEEKA